MSSSLRLGKNSWYIDGNKMSVTNRKFYLRSELVTGFFFKVAEAQNLPFIYIDLFMGNDMVRV